MSAPLDYHVTNRNGSVRAARLFSNIVSPPVMFAALGLAVALRELPFWKGMTWAAAYGFLVSLAPILIVLYLLKTNRISELHMSSPGERHLPYLAAFVFSAIAFALFSAGDGPPLMRCLTLFNMVELAALGLINVFWLISIHATGIVATLVITGLTFGWPVASIVVLPFVVAVCGVRLYLRRHTLAQVLAGAALGIVSVASLSLLGCF